MNYSVTIKFVADHEQYACAPLASFRGDTQGEGWVVRIDGGILSAVSAPSNYMPVSMRLSVDNGEHVVEWRVVDDRHELWLNGVPMVESMGGLFLGNADTLRLGEDPEMPGKNYAGVLEVTIG